MSVFKGPVFIVGLPRSGTKLLRDLLNQNPGISIPEAETHFIPYFVRKYGVPPQFLKHREVFSDFCDELEGSLFCRYMQERGYEFNAKGLARTADLGEWASIFEHLLRHFGPRSGNSDVIFGDKTPGYLKVMGELKEIFPGARFVHIVRDPRDVCLSAWRAWSLHPYRVAEEWQETLLGHRKTGHSLGDYLEVRYEELLTTAEDTLRRVCGFLGCRFVSEMKVLSKSNENTGFAKGITEILSTNMNKFWSGFSHRQIKRIEEIAFEEMNSLGYEIYLAKGSRPLNSALSGVLRRRNAVVFLQWKARSRGLGETTRYLLTRSTRRL